MRKMMLCLCSVLLALMLPLQACAQEIVYGADVGWLSQLEASGYTWQDTDGTADDVLDILAAHGVDSIRLRVFVKPPSSFTWTKDDGTGCLLGYCDTTGLLYMAQRAKSKGFSIMVDFHYSDHFADPEYQDIPEEWEGVGYSDLVSYVYDYTYYVMNQLAQNNIYPEYVQVGNEINSGILLPYGSSGTYFGQLAGMLNSGYDAVKAVSPNSRVVTHLANGQNNTVFRWFFDNFLTTYNGKTDVIGMSYYPYWIGSSFENNIDDLVYNLTDMAQRYDKEVMVCEIGGDEDDASESYELIQAVIDAVHSVPDNKGLGVYWWEPEANSNVLPDGYALGMTQQVSSKVLRFTNAVTAFEDSAHDIFPNGARRYKIVNKNSGMALNVAGGSSSNEASIEQYAYSEWDSQKWQLAEAESGYYKIVNKNSGLVLDIYGMSTSSGGACIQYAYNGGWNQMWSLQETSDGYYKLVNRNSGLVLGISDNSTSEGGLCVQLTDSGADNQKWMIQVIQ
ncbi:MAG: glycosyl hydrolase 53 family protein [Lachnospiraceae bacterium]|nr:glycosyl hydrolase 53 family protein [Lachnospiraceae bacterium]